MKSKFTRKVSVMNKFKSDIQLYTVRDKLGKDFSGILESTKRNFELIMKRLKLSMFKTTP
jgi:hypothetical protein